MILKNLVDFRPNSSSSSEGISQTTINIIEQNTGTQVNYEMMYTELVVTAGQVTRVYKYENATKTRLLFDTTINWVDGVPSTVVTTNVDDNIITTTTLGGWTDGIPTTITKVKA